MSIHWGATNPEIARPLPGDDLVVNPFLNATRSVTISAPPERIWPWIVQIAREDVGWYSYDYVDNGGRESARSLNLDRTYVRGEALPLGSDGSDLGFYVEDLRTNEWLICTNKVRGMSFVLLRRARQR